MSDERTAAAKRPFMKEHAQGEARLDRERAATELKRFLDLAVREMGLAIEYEIVTPDSVAGGRRRKRCGRRVSRSRPGFSARTQRGASIGARACGASLAAARSSACTIACVSIAEIIATARLARIESSRRGWRRNACAKRARRFVLIQCRRANAG